MVVMVMVMMMVVMDADADAHRADMCANDISVGRACARAQHGQRKQ
jgi:hypothetical protein